MYQIEDNTLRSILKRKYESLVGNCLEEIDYFQKNYNLNVAEINQFKRFIKKMHYDAMREIESQISSFSNGVKIGVSLTQPTKE